MNIVKRYRISKLEKELSARFADSLSQLLSSPFIEQLSYLYNKKSELQTQLNRLKKKKDRLEKSIYLGDSFYCFIAYWPEDKIVNALSEIESAIYNLQKRIGLHIESRHIIELTAFLKNIRRTKSVISPDQRNLIIKSNLKCSEEKEVVFSAAFLSGFELMLDVSNATYQSLLVFEALRKVNSNYSELSNFEIWIQTFLLKIVEPDAHQGLVNLTKGAYFELLVEAKFNGDLHDSFNVTDTDIWIEGVEYQIKATSQLGVINNVDSTIPIIATSEIASKSRAIDSGFSNSEVDEDTESVLGGDLFQLKDSVTGFGESFLNQISCFSLLKGLAATGDHLRSFNVSDRNQHLSDVERFDILFEATLIGVLASFKHSYYATVFLWNPFWTIFRYLLNALHFIFKPFIR